MGDRPQYFQKALLGATTSVTILLSVLALSSGNSVFLVALGVFGLVVTASAILQSRGFERVGHYLFWSATNFVIFVHADSLPLNSMIHLFFLLAILFPLLVGPARDWKQGLVPSLAACGLWALCVSYGPGLLLEPARLPQIFSPLYSLISVAALLGVFMVKTHRELLQLAVQLEQSSQESTRQERMVALAQLAAEVAHDVNNPLTLILAKAERISRRTRSNQAFDEQIDADAQRVVQTVDRIALTIARLHASARNEIDFEQEYGASNELKVSHSHR
jgi:signal transduction histidine kinase